MRSRSAEAGIVLEANRVAFVRHVPSDHVPQRQHDERDARDRHRHGGDSDAAVGPEQHRHSDDTQHGPDERQERLDHTAARVAGLEQHVLVIDGLPGGVVRRLLTSSREIRNRLGMKIAHITAGDRPRRC